MRVVDFTTTIAGPYCTRMMADLGAEVIKIETAEGDMMRTRQPLRDGASTAYGQLNAGKQSIVLDLKRVGGDAMHVREADLDTVVVGRVDAGDGVDAHPDGDFFEAGGGEHWGGPGW